MNQISIYKSEEGKKQVLQFYDGLLTKLSTPFERLNIDTRFGSTHVLKIGIDDGPPVITFHGGNSLNPYDLKNLESLCNDYSIYAPDTIGHPGYSAETRISPKTLDYGYWAQDILDGLNITKANFIGPSFGGGILARLAVVAPERIQTAIFVVPTGFVKSSPWKMLSKLVGPMIMYKISPNKERLENIVGQLADEIDLELLTITDLVFRHLDVEDTMPRPAKNDEFLRLEAPVLLITADRDILNPGKAIIKRAKEIIPNLVESECLEDTPHAFYTVAGQRDYVLSKIDAFLKKYSER